MTEPQHQNPPPRWVEVGFWVVGLASFTIFMVISLVFYFNLLIG